MDDLVSEIRDARDRLLPGVEVYVRPEDETLVAPIAELHGIPIIVSDRVPPGTALLINLRLLHDAPTP